MVKEQLPVLLIQNGYLHTMTNRPAQGDILLAGGRILQVAERIDPHTLEPERVIDASGLHVCPGLIDPHMHLVRASAREEDDVPAQLQAALDAGVTTCTLWPEEGGATCRTYHGTSPAASGYAIQTLNAAGLDDAHLRAAMEQAAKEQRHLGCEIHGASSLRRVLALGRDTGCRLILTHLTGCHAMAEAIAVSGYPVILGACCLRSGGSSYDLAAKLQALGATVALTADYPATRLHHLPLCAGLCARAGMPREDALACVTVNAARLLGLETVCGALAPGMRADLALFDGDPLMLATARIMTVCGGEILP